MRAGAGRVWLPEEGGSVSGWCPSTVPDAEGLLPLEQGLAGLLGVHAEGSRHSSG